MNKRKWNCSKEDRKIIIDMIKRDYNFMKRSTRMNDLDYYAGYTRGLLHMTFVMGCMSIDLFDAYHDVIQNLYTSKRHEIIWKGGEKRGEAKGDCDATSDADRTDAGRN